MKISKLDGRKNEINRAFENAFLIANYDTLQNLTEYSSLKQSVEDIKFYNEEKKFLNSQFQMILADQPLLSSYANVISVMFTSLKKLSKVTGEVTYSWTTFLSIVDQILSKILRELTARLEVQNNAKN
jgi:predicted nuclease with TOPRIM domain